MTTQFKNGYALLIGVNENFVNGLALPEVAKDIKAVEQVLAHPERCAYPPDNVRILMGKEATRQGILDGLAWLEEHIQSAGVSSTTAVVYYTGHGWRDKSTKPPEYYLIPYDLDEGKLKSHALRAADFAKAIGELQVQRLLVVLDCCHAAGMGVKAALPAEYVEAALAPSLLMKGEKSAVSSGESGAKGIEQLAIGKGRAVLSSSTSEQRSWIRADGKMSIFTYHFIEALTGHAAPAAGAGEVLVSDVMSYVWRQVPKTAMAEHGAEQRPDFQVSGNFPVALLLGGKGLSKGELAPDPLEASATKVETEVTRRIDTGGGAYIAGGVTTGGGDFVGRDKIVYGDEVRGDKVGGDKISARDIGPGVALGRGASVRAGTVAGRNVELGKGAEATQDDFLAVLEEIRSEFAALRSQLEPHDAADVRAELETVEEMARRDKPPAQRIIRKLNEIGDIVQSGAGAFGKFAPLLPLLQQAAAMAQRLFGG